MRSSTIRCPPEQAIAIRRILRQTTARRLAGGNRFLRGLVRGALELHRAAAVRDPDQVLRREPAFENPLRERVLDGLLDGALERPRSVDRVETALGELGERAFGDFELHLELRQPLLEVAQLDPGDALDVLFV